MRAALVGLICLLGAPAIAAAASDGGAVRLGVGITEGLGIAKSGYCSYLYLDSLPAPRVRASVQVTLSFETWIL